MKEEEIIRKIDKIKNNCINTAKQENSELKLENDKVEKELLESKVSKYEAEAKKRYEEEASKLRKDYNKNIFNYEMESKKKLAKFKNTLLLNIHRILIEKFVSYIETDAYESYLKNSIGKVLSKVGNNEKCVIYITEKDNIKYGERLRNLFEIQIETIIDDYIGGCMLVNKTEKVSIDNTLKNNIYERVNHIIID